MGLRTTAARDAQRILNNKATGAGWDISIYDPAAPTVEHKFVGFSNDISFTLDPDTDDYISSRTASVAVSLIDIYAEAMSGIPEAVANTAAKPWIVEFLDLNGQTHRFKVAKSLPDRGIDMLVLYLEVYV